MIYLSQVKDQTRKGAVETANVVNKYGVEINFGVAVNLMDDVIREELSNEIAPCSDQEFFDEYCKRDVNFELAKENPVY